jgi:hypothetical protein
LADVLPYFVPASATVTWDPWLLREGEEWRPLPDEIEGWDPGTDLEITRRVQIVPDRFRQETGLDIADVALAVSWTSSTTNMVEAAPLMIFDAGGAAIVTVVLPGTRISGVLRLRTTISMIRPPAARVPGVAWLLGSVLTEDARRVVLESSASMFPVHEIDFAATRLSPTASWHLETGSDLTASFYGTYRLLINERDAELSKAVARGAKDRRQQALMEELEAGIAALLLEIAVHAREEVNERVEWPADSVGDVLSRVLSASGVRLSEPSTPQELADFRTTIAGAVRAGGKGRTFQ